MQIHGGGWVIGDKREQGIPLLTHMAAQAGWASTSTTGSAPAATFPDHLVDCKRAIAWIQEHADEYGIDPDFICVTGGSAGGHLTALMALTANDPRFQPGFEDADTLVAAAVPFYGIYDFTPNGAFAADPRDLPPVPRARGDEGVRRRGAGALRGGLAACTTCTRRVPPFFVIHGDRDTLAPVEDARAFVERAAGGVERSRCSTPRCRAPSTRSRSSRRVRTARVIEGVERFLTHAVARRATRRRRRSRRAGGRPSPD